MIEGRQEELYCMEIELSWTKLFSSHSVSYRLQHFGLHSGDVLDQKFEVLMLLVVTFEIAVVEFGKKIKSKRNDR